MLDFLMVYALAIRETLEARELKFFRAHPVAIHFLGDKSSFAPFGHS
jgi:hypothetical protein